MMKVTVRDEFMNIELTGEFKTEEEAREFYSFELGCFPEEVEVIKIEEKKEIKRS